MSIHVKDSYIQPDFGTLLAYLKAGAALSYGYETYSYQPKTLHYKYETNHLPGFRCKRAWHSRTVAAWIPQLRRICDNGYGFKVTTSIPIKILKARPCTTKMQ